MIVAAQARGRPFSSPRRVGRDPTPALPGATTSALPGACNLGPGAELLEGGHGTDLYLGHPEQGLSPGPKLLFVL